MKKHERDKIEDEILMARLETARLDLTAAKLRLQTATAEHGKVVPDLTPLIKYEWEWPLSGASAMDALDDTN